MDQIDTSTLNDADKKELQVMITNESQKTSIQQSE